MKKGLTYYDILGLKSTNISPDEVKKARNELIRHLHPDVTNSEYAEEVVKIINEAYEVLSDPKKKREYDLHLKEEDEGRIKLDSESFDLLINLLNEINEREQRIQEAREQEIKFIKHNLPKSEYRVGSDIHVESATINKSKVSSDVSASSYQSLEGLDRPYWIAAFIFLTLICVYLLVITALRISFINIFFLIIFALIDYYVFSHIKKK